MKISAVHNYQNQNTANFKGLSSGYNKLTEGLARGIGKIIDTPAMQKVTDKFYNSNNIATHIFSATGILLSGFFMLSTARNPKIEEERKKPLIVNTAISCAFATIGGYTIDNLLNKPIDKFVDKFQKANADSPNLHKYKAGIKVAKSALIFGTLYKFVIPVISTFLAEKYVERKQK